MQLTLNLLFAHFTGAFLPDFTLIGGSNLQRITDHFVMVKRLLDVVIAARQAGSTTSVSKIGYLSRYYDRNAFPILDTSNPLDDITAWVFAKPELSIASSSYEIFRQRHADMETIIRNSKLEYFVLRAPPRIYT
jgi:hypothetical protein